MKFLTTTIALLCLSSGNSFGQTTAGAEARLKEKNIALTAPSLLLGNYLYAVQTGNLLFVSGTVPEMKGKAGKDLTVSRPGAVCDW